MKKKLKKIFDKLTPPHKKLLIMATVIVVGGGVVMYGYSVKSSHRITIRQRQEKTKKITLDTKLLDKAFSSNVKQEFKKRDEEMERMKSLMEEMKREFEKSKKSSDTKELSRKSASEKLAVKSGKSVRDEKSGKSRDASRSYPFPPPPSSRNRAAGYRKRAVNNAGKVVKRNSIGGIEIIKNVGAPGEAGRNNRGPAGKRKGEITGRSIYLPPSFMEATLLTGFSAATMQSAKTYEKPALLRIKDMAVLPNEVKSNLKGCFILASAHGDLADERAHVRLVSLSCIARNGQSVIDAPVKGFVVDSDGKIGLSGNVVTKVGALLGRSLMAGFFGGVGDALKASTTVTSVSSLGTTQTIDTEELTKAGIGGGASEGFGQLQKFYLDMAKQTLPVIEVGATKKVTVVIEEGVNLRIKDYCIGDFDKCSEKAVKN